MASPLESLLAELQPDEPGGAAQTVEDALAATWDRLIDVKRGAGSGMVVDAAERVARAIEALQQYRARLEELAADLESIEQDIALLQSGDSAVGGDGVAGR